MMAVVLVVCWAGKSAVHSVGPWAAPMVAQRDGMTVELKAVQRALTRADRWAAMLDLQWAEHLVEHLVACSAEQTEDAKAGNLVVRWAALWDDSLAARLVGKTAA